MDKFVIRKSKTSSITTRGQELLNDESGLPRESGTDETVLLFKTIM